MRDWFLQRPPPGVRRAVAQWSPRVSLGCERLVYWIATLDTIILQHGWRIWLHCPWDRTKSKLFISLLYFTVIAENRRLIAAYVYTIDYSIFYRLDIDHWLVHMHNLSHWYCKSSIELSVYYLGIWASFFNMVTLPFVSCPMVEPHAGTPIGDRPIVNTWFALIK